MSSHHADSFGFKCLVLVISLCDLYCHPSAKLVSGIYFLVLTTLKNYVWKIQYLLVIPVIQSL